ncbi:hypothetical protein GCK32_018914 [Trichostrongylus colubriformis]|uniref:Uncharacterized protein n=1 Tax=Trichostrongylus colubriformis TaxID=6319 RepID=A0AAN8F4R9_TRICO
MNVGSVENLQPICLGTQNEFGLNSSTCTQFSEDLYHLVILLWHIEQPTALQRLPSPHAGAVTTVSFLPTGRHLISGGEDGVVACYRIPQAGMTSPGNIEREDDNMGYFDQRDENEPMDMAEGDG